MGETFLYRHGSFMMLYGKNGEMVLEHNGVKQSFGDKPIELLKGHLRSFRSPSMPELPPFTGGAIGFLWL